MDHNGGYDAFLLLTLSNCSLLANGTLHSGSLALECVTIPTPTPASGAEDAHLYLVLRINELEFPVAPMTRVILKVLESGARKYTFLATETEGFLPTDLNDLVSRAVHEATIRSSKADSRVKVRALNFLE